MKEEIGERIKYVRTQIKMSQDEFAKSLDVQQAQLSATELGRIGITLNMTIKMATIYNINLNWLYLGIGNVKIENDRKIDIENMVAMLNEIKMKGYTPSK